MFKAVKVRIYPTTQQQVHLAQAFGCARWVWNQSLATISQTYKETGKGLSAFDMKKQIPVWKVEHNMAKRVLFPVFAAIGTKPIASIYQVF